MLHNSVCIMEEKVMWVIKDGKMYWVNLATLQATEYILKGVCETWVS